MRTVTYTFPTQNTNVVAATQSFTASSQSVVLNGALSNFAMFNTPGYGSAYAVPGGGIQRTVTITCSGNISTSTFTISGFDCRATGLLATTIAGPNANSATTSTEFAKVVSISVGTTASIPFTVGFGATGSTNPFQVDTFANPVGVAFSIAPATSCPIVLQKTYDAVQTASSPTWLTLLASGTTATSALNSDNITAVRAIFLATAQATTAGVVTFVQAGS